MVDSDLSKIKKKRPKIAISLSLDKKNMDILKEDMKKAEEESGEEITLSSVFDYFLSQFVKSIKTREENEKENGKL